MTILAIFTGPVCPRFTRKHKLFATGKHEKPMSLKLEMGSADVELTMGPLHGIRIIEFAGIGPAPFCGMLLADMGAEVILVERKSSNPNAPGFRSGIPAKFGISNRGKKSIAVDLKKEGAADLLFKLIAGADGLIEGFRPGVMERLGLGPQQCLEVNPALVYGRVTGWGQSGPLAHAAGHDINYIALSGALFHGGHRDSVPSAPPTLVGDVGGGALMLTIGLLAAIIQARETKTGQVIDAAITDGSALMTSLLYGVHQAGLWTNQRQDNFLDGGAHWYDCYECADQHYISIGALEPAFYNELLKRCDLAGDADYADQFAKQRWPELREKMAAMFRTRSRDEWCELLEGSDACFAPVLNFAEAPDHPHNRERQTFVERDGVVQPAPAPRFSATPAEIGDAPPMPGQHTLEVLRGIGLNEPDIEALRADGVVADA